MPDQHNIAREAIAEIAIRLVDPSNDLFAASKTGMAAILALVADQDKRLAELEASRDGYARKALEYECLYDAERALTKKMNEGARLISKEVAELKAILNGELPDQYPGASG